MGYYTKKNHKYISREWVHGKWKYFYGKAKSAGNKYVTGKSAKEAMDRSSKARGRYEKLEADRDAKVDEQINNRVWKPNEYNRESLLRNNNSAGVYHDMARRAGIRENNARREYEGSLAGKASKTKATIQKGAAILKKFFSGETKVTVKDTFTGETRTPKQTGNDVINIKELSEKNKKKKR